MVVVEVFADAAVSGATTDRDGLHRLLFSAKSRRFDLVLVDDLSRLSRDLGDLFRIVFDDFRLAEVVLLDSQTGMRSDAPGARMTFGAVGLASDAFLQMVKHETHRGLEGRALAGFHTGGRCYGYKSIPESSPADPAHPRAVQIIDLAQAATVRRIFERFAADASPREIAAELNREGIPAPYDGCGYEKPAGAGWGHVTIRQMIRNERYIGRVTWNRRQWNRFGVRKHRIPKQRPPEQWITTEHPELVIIGRELWDRAQQRVVQRSQWSGPKTRAGFRTSPLSGLLRCGSCGAHMSIVGATKKKSEIYRMFGCGANRSKGSEICANSVAVSEKKLLSALVATVRASLDRPAFRERFEETFRRLWAMSTAHGASSREAEGVASEIRSREAKLQRLLALVEDGHGDVDVILTRIRELEANVRELRQRQASAAQRESRSTSAMPDTRRLFGLFDDLEKLLLEEPAAARQALDARFTPIILTPRGDAIHLETGLKIGAAALVSRDGRKVCWIDNCGGLIDTVQQTPILLISSDISQVRGVSRPDRLVRSVQEPRWLVSAG
jgi:site-specific DNA recombinase